MTVQDIFYARNLMLENQSKLEKMIDSIGMPEVLKLLQNVAYEKEQHLLENWQSKTDAMLWRKIGDKLNTPIKKITEIDLNL